MRVGILWVMLMIISQSYADTFKIGLFDSLVNTRISKKDYIMGTNLLVKEILETEHIEAETLSYGDAIKMIDDFRSGKIDMIVSDPITIIKHLPYEYLETGITGYLNKKADTQTLLLLSLTEDSRMLEKKLLGDIATDGDPVGALYLQTLMLEHDLREKPVFIMTKNAQQSILKLFFKKADLALVDKGAFLTAIELNPQLKVRLNVVKSIPLTIGSVSFTRKTLNSDLRRRIIDAAHNINTTPRGKQLLRLMRADSVEECSPEELKSVYELSAKYKALQKKVSKR